jgi:electron transfer flavoprotein beta subunit
MNCIVCVKQTADLQQIRINRGTGEPILTGAPLTFGDIDKNALEAGVQLKESHGGNVTALAAGSEELTDTIKEALAMGADDAVLLLDSALDQAESSVIAEMLAWAVGKQENYGLLLLGEGSADNYSGQIGPRLAEILNLPLVTYARAIETDGDRLQVTRSLEDCLEIVTVKLPAIVTVTSDINEARIPAVTQILKAGRKPVRVYRVPEMPPPSPEKTRTLSNLAPRQERKGVMFTEGAEQAAAALYQVLKTEGLTEGY